MKGNKLPGSMDLLLDTMCNTFGGVVFIALSLTLAFFVGRTQTSPEDIAKVKQEIEARQKESLALEETKATLNKKLSSLQELSSQFSPTKSNLPNLVAKLEQDSKDLAREIDVQRINQRELENKIRYLSVENRKMKEQLRQRGESATARNKTLSEEYNTLNLVYDQRNAELQRTSTKKVHFSHYAKTSSSPYIVLVKDNRLCRLGRDYRNISKEVTVHRTGNMLKLTGKGGTPLRSITAADLRTLLEDFNKSTSFLWIIVHPDSFVSFVGFRRLLREASLPVYWYIENEAVLYLGSGVSYSSSN